MPPNPGQQAAQQAAQQARQAAQQAAQQARQAAQQAAAVQQARQAGKQSGPAQQARQAGKQSAPAQQVPQAVDWKSLRRLLAFGAVICLVFYAVFYAIGPFIPAGGMNGMVFFVGFLLFLIVFVASFPIEAREGLIRSRSKLNADLSSLTPPPDLDSMTPPPDLDSMTPPPDLDSMAPPPDDDSQTAESSIRTPVPNAGPKASAPSPATTDTAIQQAWYLLTSRIAQRLASLKDGGPGFMLEDASLPYYVRFSWNREEQALICEAVGNGNLEAPHQLSEDQQTLLRNMGWHPPGRGDAYRSPNFVRVFFSLSNFSVAASLGVASLRNAYGVNPTRVSWRKG